MNEPQTPAEGILLHKDWGDAKSYTVECECTDQDHAHSIWIEADDAGVTVTTHTTQSTNSWEEAISVRYDIESKLLQEIEWARTGFVNGLIRRLKLTWAIWFKGYVKYEASLCMTRQQALNYAAALNKAVVDVEEFRKAKG